MSVVHWIDWTTTLLGFAVGLFATTFVFVWLKRRRKP